ncbi:MAG TPA: acyltransferase family protein [Reyranellaceae bacterium]|nr:acyltransferase family protein [Reyranellaceae bacterium]
MPLANGAPRRPEFDWLRVVALGLLIVFHGAVGFSENWHWHVVDPHNSPALDAYLTFQMRWRVTLVFVVSGAALMLALGARSPIEVARERVLRLLVPLVFGILVIVPPQIWLERLAHGQFNGSYLAFLGQLFNGIYPNGNLSWHHLWFLPYVLVLSLLLAGPFAWARSPAGRRALDPTLQAVARRHAYWLLVLPLMGAEALLHLQQGDAHTFIYDSHGWAVFVLLMLLGGAIALWSELLAAIQRGRWAAIAVGIAAFAVLELMGVRDGIDPAKFQGLKALAWCMASAANMLAWVLAAIGFITRWLTRGSAVLGYLSEAALPVYILHQTITIAVVYQLRGTGWPLAVEMTITIAASLLGSFAIYEFAIRHSPWLRPLFGMKVAGASITNRWAAPSSSGRQPS